MKGSEETAAEKTYNDCGGSETHNICPGKISTDRALMESLSCDKPLQISSALESACC